MPWLYETHFSSEDNAFVEMRLFVALAIASQLFHWNHCGSFYRDACSMPNNFGITFIQIVKKEETTLKLTEGATVGPYRVARLIGTGGMGVVYEVEHVALGMRRALKVFNMTGARSTGFRERFLSEGRLLARLSHPNIVRVYDLGWDDADGTPWYAMDLVLGPEGKPRTLAGLTHGATEESQVAKWFASLCATIGYIHSQGVLHRDT